MTSSINRLEVLVDKINTKANEIPLNALLIQLRESEYLLRSVDVIVDEFFVTFIVANNPGSESDIKSDTASLEVLISNLSQLKLSWLDRVAVKCRDKYQASTIEQHVCSTWTIKKFEFLALLYHWVSHINFYSDELERKRVRALSDIFHEPEHKVKKLIVKNKCYSWKFRKSRERYLSESFETGVRIDWPQRSAYRHYNNCCVRSRVLITIHMGDFLGALREVSNEGDLNRRVISIRQGDDHDVYKNVIPNSIRHEVINRQSVSPLNIVSRLREGNHTVVALTDLHGNFGETQRVKFLGVDMDFVKGPVLMAVLGRADLVPMVTFDDRGINSLHTGPILHSRRSSNESLDLTLSRLMQRLFTWFEGYVLKKPEQWKYFPDSPAFLSHIDRR